MPKLCNVDLEMIGNCDAMSYQPYGRKPNPRKKMALGCSELTSICLAINWSISSTITTLQKHVFQLKLHVVHSNRLF
jgi:hypothetical protein